MLQYARPKYGRRNNFMKYHASAGCLFVFILTTVLRGAYNPPTYPQKSFELERLRVTLPPEVCTGENLAAEILLDTSKGWRGPAHFFVQFLRDGRVLHVHVAAAPDRGALPEDGRLALRIPI